MLTKPSRVNLGSTCTAPPSPGTSTTNTRTARGTTTSHRLSVTTHLGPEEVLKRLLGSLQQQRDGRGAARVRRTRPCDRVLPYLSPPLSLLNLCPVVVLYPVEYHL